MGWNPRIVRGENSRCSSTGLGTGHLLEEGDMSNRNRNPRQPRAGRPQVEVEASVGAGTLAEKLEEAGIKRETLPPGPAPQPKKEEKRPPSIGRAKSEI